MINKGIQQTLFFLFLSLSLYGQSTGNQYLISQELKFINHLMGRGDYDEALFLLKNLEVSGNTHRDSVIFLNGWINYSMRSLEVSAAYLERVSETSPLYLKSTLFAAYNYAHIGFYDKARKLLYRESVSTERPVMDLVDLQRAGLCLLNRDLDGFGLIASGFKGQNHHTANQESRMFGYAMDLKDRRSKSPLAAGVFSAVIPGMGKVYAGKTAEGIAGLMYVSAMGLVAWDFYGGRGAGDPLFLASAALAGIFYLGNIKGSVATARRVNTEFYYEMDQRILFDMHIPLRSFFR